MDTILSSSLTIKLEGYKPLTKSLITNKLHSGADQYPGNNVLSSNLLPDHHRQSG